MRRTSRLFELIQALRGASRPQTAAELAGKLEVCKRTIYRDVASLQAMGIPIQGEAGIGYVMQPGFDLPPLMLSIDEVEAVVVALCLLQRTGDTGLKAAAETLRAKIQGVLPRSVSAPLLADSLYATPDGLGEIGNVDVTMVRRAVREEQKLHLDYVDRNGSVTRRVVRPIALIYDVDAHVIVAWCELRGAFRRFRGDRIRSCSILPERFHGEGDKLRILWQAELGVRTGDWSSFGHRALPA
jgi:predicted DNA-binding transcriptional regulator YafY